MSRDNAVILETATHIEMHAMVFCIHASCVVFCL